MAMINLATRFPDIKAVVSICSSNLNCQTKENSKNQSHLSKQWNMIIAFDPTASEKSEIRQIKILLTSFKNISELKFANGYLPTDEDIDTLSGSLIEGLKVISLNCLNVTDRGIISIANKCTSLESVVLFDIKHLTDFSIKIITKKNLKELNLGGLKRSYVTEKQLNAMIENLIDVEFLYLEDWTYMDNAPVMTDDIM